MKVTTIKKISPKEIKGITLLSVEEAENFPKEILSNGDWWWLQSIGCRSYLVAIVTYFGSINLHGDDVDENRYGVRPALILDSLKLKNGDFIKVFDKEWYYQDGLALLMGKPLTHMAFNKDSRGREANIYQKSDVKKWLDNWLKEQKRNMQNEI